MSAKEDLAICATCHCLAARRRARALTKLYEAKLRSHGLRATQFSVLAALAIAGSKPLSGFAKALGLDRTTLSRAVAVMARKGWVDEVPSTDGRERLLRLSGVGRRKLEVALPAWKSAQREAEQLLK